MAVTTRILTEYLRTAESYCESYDLPLAHLLQEQAYAQAETIMDCPFSTLERMDDHVKATETSEVVLQFCPEVYAILSRIAKILRRPLPELLHGLLDEAGWCLQAAVGDGLKTDDEIDRQDLESWADEAIAFERLAKRGKTPSTRGGDDGWDAFSIERPHVRAANNPLAA